MLIQLLNYVHGLNFILISTSSQKNAMYVCPYSGLRVPSGRVDGLRYVLLTKLLNITFYVTNLQQIFQASLPFGIILFNVFTLSYQL